MQNNYELKTGKSLIWIGVGLGGFYGVFAAFVHCVIFKTGTFGEELFTDDPMEIWMRLSAAAIFFAFGCFAQFVYNKLQKASDKIKILRGSIPYCAKCKRIRDDKGEWNRIEVYIREHSEAEFSFGFCQECAKKHYPDFDFTINAKDG